MLKLEVLVGELLAVDGPAAGAVVIREVPALQHEPGNDAVERAALEKQAEEVKNSGLEIDLPLTSGAKR